MKRAFLYIALFLFVGCHSQPGNQRLSAIARLPAFKMISLDSSQCINTVNLPYGSSTLFIYFSPDCEHCQQTIKEILRNEKELRSVNIYLVTNDSHDAVKKFYHAYRLDTVSNMFVGNDFNYSFYKLYLPASTPYIVIYNKKKELVKIYCENVAISSIVKSIN